MIRISQGERDASARATHLEAATRKFLVSTNERKQMSTKTNFKRIALVAIAALGMGVLSSVPSQAVGNAHTVTITAGSQKVGGSLIAESGTATSIAFSFIANANTRLDTYTLSATLKSGPALSVALPILMLDTYTADTEVDTDQVIGAAANLGGIMFAGDTRSSTVLQIRNATDGRTTAKLVSAQFKLMMPADAVAGSYVVTVLSDPLGGAGNSDNVPATGVDVTLTVTAKTLKADAARSTVFLSNGANSNSSLQTVDSAVSAVATASTTARGQLRVTLKGATSATDADTAESVTVTTTVGLVGPASGGGTGRSVVFAYSPNSALIVGIYSDGTAGTGTITISSASTSFTKSVSFYSATAAKITAAAYESVVGTSTAAILGTETDSNGINFASGTDLYAYSSDTSVVSNFGTACGSYNSTLGGVLCTLTGVKSGTANITLRDASTVALSTIASNAVPVTVNLNPAASISMRWDKATYAPGERAAILIQVLDKDGKSLPSGTYSGAIGTAAGISSSTFALTASSGSLAGGDVTTSVNAASSASSPVVTNAPHYQVVVTMPNTGGSIKITAKGGSGLPAAGQVEVSATATITDNAAAALAAVTALATTVASLRTLITTLTNLVLKIQKKVRA